MSESMPELDEFSTEDSHVDSEGDNLEDIETMSTGSRTNYAESTTSSNAMDEIGKEDSKLVHCSKLLVVTVLLIAAGLCAAGTYIFTLKAEYDIFQTHVR